MEAIFPVCGAGGPQLKRNPLGATHPMPQVPHAGFRDVLRSSHRFAAYFALVALSGAVGGVIFGRAPLYVVVLAPALGYAIYFVLPLILQLTGAATTDLNISLWFAWALCGGIVFFFVGAFVRGRDILAEDVEEVGLYTALAWVGLVAILRLVTRLFRKRGA